MTKKIAVIDGHPDPDKNHLCHAIVDAYTKGADGAGHEIKRIDVGRLDFPFLRIPSQFASDDVPPAIKDAQAALLWADHIVIVFPLWLGTMPALLKAFLEQTIRPGFAFEETQGAWPKRLLVGRSATVIVTMGMPGFIYRWYFCAHGLKNLKRNILRFCGLSPVRDTIFGMVEAVGDDKRRKWLNQVERMGAQAI